MNNMNVISTTLPARTVKNTAYYMALRTFTCLLFALLIIMALSLIFLPNKASAATTNSTYYIPVAGLGYYVDANGNPIGTSQQQYTCVNGTCRLATQTATTTPTSTQQSYPYPKYNTPVKENGTNNYNQGSYTSPYPYPGYSTPVANTTGGTAVSQYYAYPTYGSTPVYGRVDTPYTTYSTNSYTAPVASNNTKPLFQLSGGSAGGGGFTMTSSAF